MFAKGGNTHVKYYYSTPTFITSEVIIVLSRISIMKHVLQMYTDLSLDYMLLWIYIGHWSASKYVKIKFDSLNKNVCFKF